MNISKLAILAMVTLTLTPTAFADGVAQAVDTLETDVSTLASQLSLLQTENADLEVVIEELSLIVDDLVSQQSELVALQRCHAIGGAAGRSISEDGTHGVNWRGCDKRRIVLEGPRFGGTEMTALLFNADLRGTDFSGAYLFGVAMNGSNLDGANFTNANLSGSNLDGANIVTRQQAQDYSHLGLQETIFDNTTCPDGKNSDLHGETCANNRTPLP